MKYLYPYECSKKKLSSPAELQAAIDGNRRDSRRSFGSFLSQAVPSDGSHPYNSPSPTTTPPAFTPSNTSPGLPHRSSPGPSASNHDVSYPLKFSLWFITNNIRADLISGEKNIRMIITENNSVSFYKQLLIISSCACKKIVGNVCICDWNRHMNELHAI